MPSFLLIQWGLVGFFVFIHLMIGFFRGSVKSIYYLAVNVLIALGIFFFLSQISLGMFISSDQLINLIQSNTGNAIPQDIVTLLGQEDMYAYVLAIVDVVLKLLLFIILYTIIRFIVTFIVFGLIWSQVIEKRLYPKYKIIKVMKHDIEVDKKVRIKPRRHVTLLDRLVGSFIGAFRGLVTIFIFMIPLLVLVSSFDNIQLEQTEDISILDLSTSQELESLVPNEVFDIIDLINELNEGNLSNVFGNLGPSIFDATFSTSMGNETFNLKEELDVITQSVNVIYNAGYLNDDFDFNTIDSSDIAAITSLFDLIASSHFITQTLSIGTDVLASGLLEEELGFSFEGRPGDESFHMLSDIDFTSEITQLGVIIEKILTFRSVNQLQDIASNPEEMLTLTELEAKEFTDIIRAIAHLESLKLIGAGIDYATTLDAVKNLVQWIPESDREAYLSDMFHTLITDPEFFSGEDGELYLLAHLIENLYKSHDQFSLPELLTGDIDIDVMFTEGGHAFVEETLKNIVALNSIGILLPMAVDFGLHQASEFIDDAIVLDTFEDIFDSFDIEAEFSNISDIYQTLVTLGASRFLDVDANVIALIDDIVLNNLDDVRTLVDQIFIKSVLINEGLEVALPFIFDTLLEEGDLKTLIEEIVFENDQAIFSVGEELVLVIDIMEALNNVSSIEDILEATTDITSLIDFLDDVVPHKIEDIQVLISTVFELTLLDRVLNHAFEDVLSFILTDEALLEIAMLFVRDNALTIDIESDLIDGVDMLGILYEVTTLRELLEDTGETQLDAALNVLNVFGQLEENDFSLLVTHFKELSVIEALNKDVLGSLTTLALDTFIEEGDLNNLIQAIVFEGDVFVLDLKTEIDVLVSILDALRDVSDLNSLAEAATDVSSLIDFLDDVVPHKIEDIQVLISTVFELTLLDRLLNHAFEDILSFILTDEALLEIAMLFVRDNALTIDIESDLIDVVEIMSLGYEFASLKVLLGDAGLSTLDTAVRLADIFGRAEEVDALEIISLITNLETIRAFDSEVLNEIVSLFGLNILVYVSDDVVLADELSNIFTLLYETSAFMHEGLKTNAAVDIDFGPFLDTIKPFILSSNNNKLIVENVAHNFKFLISLSGLSDMIKLPSTLNNAEPDSLEWAVEYDNIINAIFAILETIHQDIDLSTREIFELASDTSAAISIVSNLVDLNNQQDDALRNILKSDIIYYSIASTIDSEEFNDTLLGSLPEDVLSLLGDFSIFSPTDARNTTGLFEGLFSRDEIYALVRSIKYLNIDFTNVDLNFLSYIFDLIDANTVNGVDDFDRFIASKYIQDKVSGILLSDFVLDLISLDFFTPTVFLNTLPSTGKQTIETKTRIAEGEFKKVFASLQTLGLTDLSDVNFGIESLVALTEEELETVLASDYVYTIVHLILSSQDELSIPDSAFEISGVYDDMVKKSEVINIFSALAILGGDLANIDVNALSIGDLIDLFEINSPVIDSLLTAGIEAVVTIPDASYDGDVMKRTELKAILDTLLLISNNDPDTLLTNLDIDNVAFTVLLIQSIVDLNSSFTDALISENIIALIDVPAGAIVNTNGYDSVTEIDDLLDALTILGISTLSGDINVDDVTVGQLQDLLDLQSLIINRLLSTTILATDLNIPAISLDNPKDIKVTELQGIIDALLVLANNVDTTLLTQLDVNNITFTVTLIRNIANINSFFTDALISENMIALIDVPAGAIVKTNGYDSVTEIDELLDALTILGITTLSGDINVDDVTVGQLQELLDLESVIINRLLSTTILATDLSIPAISLDNPKDIKVTELQGIIDALLVLANNDSETLLTDLDVSNITFTVTLIRNLSNINSFFTDALISENMISLLDIPAGAIVNTNGYDSVTEIDELLDALTILGITTISNDFAVDDVSVKQFQDLLNLESLIINRLLSSTILATDLNIPAISLDNPKDIKVTELQGVVDTIRLVSGNNQDALLSNLDVNNIVFTVALIRDLDAIGTFFTDALLSENIITLVDTPSRAIENTNGFDSVTEVTELLDALTILGLTTLSSGIDVDNVTILQFESLLNLESFIINRLLSSILIQSSLDIPTSSLDTLGDITKDIITRELDALKDTLLILNNQDNTGVVDDILVGIDASSLAPARLKELLALESPLINRLVASGIIATNLVETEQFAVLGDTNFDPNAINKDVKIEEMNHIVDSLETLGIQTISGISSISISDVTSLTDQEIDALLGGTVTFMYFLIENIVDTSGQSIITTYQTLNNTTLQRDPITNRILRNDLITLLKYEPVL